MKLSEPLGVFLWGFVGLFVFVLFVSPTPTPLAYFHYMTSEVFGREIRGLLNRRHIKAKIVISVQISVLTKYVV